MSALPLSARLERASLQEGSVRFFPLEGDDTRQVFQALDRIIGSGYCTWALEQEILPFYQRCAAKQKSPTQNKDSDASFDACRIPDSTYDSLVCCTWANSFANLKDEDPDAFFYLLRKILVEPFLRADRVRTLQASCQDRINQVWEDYLREHPEE